jgi:hypothetical protein
LDTAVVPDSNARVGGAEVDSDDETLCISGHRNLRMQLARTHRENGGDSENEEDQSE